ncbi:hypothetical protein [Methanobacterium spitsbergense]|uniref:Uncharacterized protein n=1 Tax=Methanobacterium spitsbergense TaxID=2874285 RepID=A0A8T5V3X8_9EURY|nr:hypothetical protein [Methanobacterium spitsbergense]MBZ2166365.1 hypothetical protein [Methanobacterium spitsbergense]
MSEQNDKEIADKIWVDVPNKRGIWDPTQEDEELVGTYLKKVSAPYMGRDNSLYCMESDHPESVEGKISFYGTTALNNLMEDALVGKKLRIIYKGEKKTGDPKKRPFKKFNIQALLAPTDPLYKKYTEGINENSIKNESAPSLKTNDDPLAAATVAHYRTLFKVPPKEVTAEMVLQVASEDTDLSPEDMSKVKVQLAAMVKADEIKAK